MLENLFRKRFIPLTKADEIEFPCDDNTDESSEEFCINLESYGESTTYGCVLGFFEFRGEIYYRARGAAGRKVDNNDKSFTDSIKELYPDEFKDYTPAKVCTIKVTPLKVII